MRDFTVENGKLSRLFLWAKSAGMKYANVVLAKNIRNAASIMSRNQIF
jgi:hypothetical protein